MAYEFMKDFFISSDRTLHLNTMALDWSAALMTTRTVPIRNYNYHSTSILSSIDIDLLIEEMF